MAHLQKIKRKNGTAYRLYYYLNNRRHTKYFPPGSPLNAVLAEKKRIEAGVTLDKAGFEKMDLAGRPTKLNLDEFKNIIIGIRKGYVATQNWKRNELALNNFIEILGGLSLISDLSNEAIEYFKAKRLEMGKTKAGINKDLVNIRTCLNAAAEREIIKKSEVPKIRKFRIDKTLPEILTVNELLEIEKKLSGHALLAFQIIKYTGARRGEICRQTGETAGGILWSNIDFENDTIRLLGKNKRERIIPLHPELKAILWPIRGVGKIIPYTATTLSIYFRKAMKQAGITKKGSVHIIRHTAATYLRAGGADLREIQEMLGHKNITTTQIYTQISIKHLKETIKKLPW